MRNHLHKMHWTAACLFAGLAAVHAHSSALARRLRLGELCLTLDDFEVARHQPHPPRLSNLCSGGEARAFLHRRPGFVAGRGFCRIDATRLGRFPAVHADRGLVGVGLSRAVPASGGGSRRSTCRARRRHCIAFVLSRRRTREGPARSPLWTGSRRSIQPQSFIQTPCDATCCSIGPAPCVVLLARRRNEIGTKSDADGGQFRDAIEKGHAAPTTDPRLCGLDGVKVASFRDDARIHDKHHLEFIFKSDEQG